MKALQLQAIRTLALIDIPRPKIGPDDLLIKTGASIICTSDINDVKSNPFNIALPVIIGHEGAGQVVEIGAHVKGFKKGDTIAAHPVHHCSSCPHCKAGFSHLCMNMGHFGLNMQGTCAEYFIVRADRARKVPKTVPAYVAALAEPICVCLEAIAQAKLPKKGRLLIMGDGPFSAIMSIILSKQNGIETTIVGHHDFRLKFAKSARTINTKGSNNSEKLIADLGGALGFDAAIMCVGSVSATEQALKLLQPKGRLVLFSALPGLTQLDLFTVHVRELEIIGACNDQNRFDESIELLINHTADFAPLITHIFNINKYNEAFTIAENGHAEALKVAIEFP